MASRNRKSGPSVKPAANQPKIVAEMPGDPEMRSRLKEQKKNDGSPGSCGI